jgi:hypothetical protein
MLLSFLSRKETSMNPQDHFADDLRHFAEARKAAKEDQDDAREELRIRGGQLVADAPALLAELRDALTQRAERLASASSDPRIEHHTVGNTTTIRLGIVEANAILQPGRPADAFGPILPFVDFRLSRTSLTIGADVMPREVATYRAPQPRSEEFRPVRTDNGLAWTVNGETKSSVDLAEYALGLLVQYYKDNFPN